jgi:hypothetical protein
MGKTAEVGAAAPPDAWTQVAGHPGFAAATRQFATNMLRLCDEDPRLCAVFKDAGRYMAAMTAAYLHGAGGLTIPLLKQMCAASGFLSPGRAGAIVEFLVHLDYLRPQCRAGQAPSYQPTDRFLSAWSRHLEAALDATALIEPALATVSAGLRRGESFGAFLGIQAARLHMLAQRPDPCPSLRRAFYHPHAGLQILWVLTLAGDGVASRDGATTTVSLSELSRRFDVTLMHVRRLLKRATEEGMITHHGRGRIAFEAEGLRQIRLSYALQMLELIDSGKAMAALSLVG